MFFIVEFYSLIKFFKKNFLVLTLPTFINLLLPNFHIIHRNL